MDTLASAGVGGVRDRVVHEPLDQRVDVTVESGREEQPLRVGRGLGQQLGDLGQEAHVGHLVGLVEHGDLDVVELAGAALDQVAEAARGGDDDLDAAPERVHLPVVRHAADGGLEEDADRAAERHQRVGDLHGQLAGRHQDQGLGAGAAARGHPARRGPAAAGRTPGSCRSRSGRGRARPGRPGRPGMVAAWISNGVVMPSRVSTRTSSAGRPSSAKVGTAGRRSRRARPRAVSAVRPRRRGAWRSATSVLRGVCRLGGEFRRRTGTCWDQRKWSREPLYGGACSRMARRGCLRQSEPAAEMPARTPVACTVRARRVNNCHQCTGQRC